MPERDRAKTSLPTVSAADRPRVSSRDSTRSASARFGSLSSAFFRKSEERDPAMGIRRMLVERDRDRSLSLSRTNVASIGNSISLVEEQNKLLAEIIREIRTIQPKSADQDQNDLNALDSMIDRVRQRAKPGRGRFGSKAQKRLERMRASRDAKSRNVKSGAKPSTAGGKPASHAVKPRVEPRVQAPAVAPDSQRVRPPTEVRTSPADRPATSAASRSALKQRIAGSVRGRLGRAVLTKVPAAGIVFGLFFGAQRAMAGDYVGAGLEVASGVAGAISFGFGTAVSLGLDATILARDLYSEAYGVNPEEDPLREERMAELTSVIGETVREIASERPTPRIPEYNSETRDQLLALYRMAQEDEELRSAIGDDVVAGLVPLLRQDPRRLGRQGDAVRAGIERSLRDIQTRLIQSGRRVSSPVQDNELINRTSSSVLEELESSEYGNIVIDAETVVYEGRISTPSGRAGAEFSMPVAARAPAPAAAAPVSVPNAVPSRPIQSVPGMTGGTTGPSGGTTGGEQPSDDFMSEVNRVSSKFGINPSDLLALMRSESSLNPQAVNRTTGATGLIQFMPATARSLGTTTEELRQMTAAQQMRYVERFFESVRLPQGASAGQLYAYVFLPGRARRDVLTTAGEAFYEANRGLDMDSDGRITVADLDVRMARFGGTAQASRMPGGTAGGVELASASGGMVAADQAQTTGAGRQVVVPQPGAQVAAERPGGIRGLFRRAMGEIPLNRRLEQQVS